MESCFTRIFWVTWVTVNLLFVMDSSASRIANHTVISGGSLRLKCCVDQGNDMQYNLQWQFNNNVLFHDTFLLDTTFSESAYLLHNNSLLLNPVLPIHVGTYKCLINSVTVILHMVSVKGMYLFLDILLFLNFRFDLYWTHTCIS